MKNSQSQTKLKEHKLTDKKLVPPLAQINMTPRSWVDDRLPEMLWAALLTVAFPRKELLERLEAVVDVACKITDTSVKDWRKKPLAVTLTGIAQLEEKDQKRIIKIIASDDTAKQSLVSMLFFDNLPAKSQWESVLGLTPKTEDTNNLLKAIANCFFHQSQQATDCRWIKALYSIKSGYVSFTPNVEETPKLILEYPKHSEEQLRRSRPTIRSMEISLDIGDSEQVWTQQFWQECYDKTPCLPQKISKKELKTRYPSYKQLAKDKKILQETNQGLTNHFWKTAAGSEKNPKHEVAFGIALYATDLAINSIYLGASRTALSRMVLRSLVECSISLKYLAKKDDPKLWSAFRTHGTGQAKLVLQRSEEEGRTSPYLDPENLGQIANDDIWVEFLSVDVGTWDDSDLRKRAIEVGMKDHYDDYYTWCSSYSHGHWGAIREAVYGLCGNPLHRFHRIPLLYSLNLKDARKDTLLLLNEIIDLLYEIFPKNKTHN